MRGRLAVWAVGVAAAALPASGAFAQQDDVQSVSVADRARPEYEALGIMVGGFRLLPRLDLTAEYNSNVFAAPSAPDGDVVLTVAPSITAEMRTPLYTVAVSGAIARDRYLSNQDENQTSYRLETRGAYGLGTATRLRASALYSRSAEQRGSLSSYSQSARPIRLTDIVATAEAEHEFGPVTAAIDSRFRRVAYSRGLDPLGQPLDYEFRNFRSYRIGGRVGFSRTGSSQLFVAGSVDRRNYDLRPGDPGFDPITGIDRNARGRRIEIGYRRQVSALLFASIQAGYLHVSYADAKLKDIDAVSFRGDLLWNVTPLTTVTARLSRAIDETVSPLSAGNLRTEGVIGADHELLRNLILSAELRYADIAPVGDGASSREIEGGVEARYLLSRRLSLFGTARHFSRSSDNRSIAYDNRVASIGVRIGL